MMDPNCSCEIPSCSAVDLAKIRLAVFQDWLVNLINNLRMVTVMGHPEEGTSQVGKSPHLNWVTQFFMVAYSGACPTNVSVRMA
jgi:hypothetical protein